MTLSCVCTRRLGATVALRLDSEVHLRPTEINLHWARDLWLHKGTWLCVPIAQEDSL